MKRGTSVVLAIVASVLTIGMFAVRRNRPVLFKMNPHPGAVRPRSYVVVNPFRDRGPEHSCGVFLKALQQGEISVLAQAVSHNRDHILLRERQYPVLSWRIGDRRDESAGSSLMYWVRRGGGYGAGEEEVHLFVRKTSTGWTVGDFFAIY